MTPLSTGVAVSDTDHGMAARLRPERTAVGATVLAWLPMLAWYAALRPGLMSADSLAVWQQATGGGWVDIHAPAYTASVWLSAQIVGGPDLVTLGQSLFLAAAIVAVSRAVARLGAPLRPVLVVSAVVAASPMVGAFAVSLWKDVPYTAAVLFAAARVFDVTRLRMAGDAVGGATVASLTAWLLVAAAFRQNGVLFALAVLAVLGIVLKGDRRRVAAAAAAVLAFTFVLKSVVYPAMGVARTPTQATIGLFLHDIAAVARTHPAVFEREDRAVLARNAPFEVWRARSASYGCGSANWQHSPDFDWAKVEGRAGDYLALWTETLREQPRRVLANRLCVGAIAWQPWVDGSVFTVSRGIDRNDLGLRTRPLIPGIERAAVATIDRMDDPAVQRLLWRGTTWIYLSLAVLAVTVARLRRASLLLAALPAVALQFSVFLVSPAQDARYMFAGVLLGAMLLPAVALGARSDGSRSAPHRSPGERQARDDGVLAGAPGVGEGIGPG
ncbi:MAG TPA: DUF6020 family protein [Acidimicrobiales bacterium]|nr:DUF6020 family protein [Acidimicrobiales bacterium]